MCKSPEQARREDASRAALRKLFQLIHKYREGETATWINADRMQRAKLSSSVRLLSCALFAFAVLATPVDVLYQRTFWLLVGAGLGHF